MNGPSRAHAFVGRGQVAFVVTCSVAQDLWIILDGAVVLEKHDPVSQRRMSVRIDDTTGFEVVSILSIASSSGRSTKETYRLAPSIISSVPGVTDPPENPMKQRMLQRLMDALEKRQQDGQRFLRKANTQVRVLFLYIYFYLFINKANVRHGALSQAYLQIDTALVGAAEFAIPESQPHQTVSKPLSSSSNLLATTNRVLEGMIPEFHLATESAAEQHPLALSIKSSRFTVDGVLVIRAHVVNNSERSYVAKLCCFLRTTVFSFFTDWCCTTLLPAAPYRPHLATRLSTRCRCALL